MSTKSYLNEFAAFLAELEDSSEILDFLQDILTPRELDELPRRLQIVKMLKQGVPQRQIAENLEVGVATVTRGARVLQEGGFRQVESKHQ